MTEEPASLIEGTADYSKAFEKLVGNADDIIGLLAYAKYKQSIREAAQAGFQTEKNARSIAPSLVGALRSAAEQMLTEVINNGIAQATPDIQSTAVVATLEAHHAELLGALREDRQRVEQHVDKRTGFWPAFGTNFLAWIVGLIITVAILYISGRPSAESTLSDRLGNAPKTLSRK